MGLLALLAAGCPHRAPWPVDGEEPDAAEPADAALLPDAGHPADARAAPDAAPPPDAPPPDAPLPDAGVCSGPDDCVVLAELPPAVIFGMGSEWHPEWGEPFAYFALSYGDFTCPGFSPPDDIYIGDGITFHDGDVGTYTITAAEDPDFHTLVDCMTDGVEEELGQYSFLAYWVSPTEWGWSGSGWYEWEPSLGFGMPDFAGETIVAVQLIVDELSLTHDAPYPGWVNMTSTVRWRILGLP
jgi:hypothetical protein